MLTPLQGPPHHPILSPSSTSLSSGIFPTIVTYEPNSALVLRAWTRYLQRSFGISKKTLFSLKG